MDNTTNFTTYKQDTEHKLNKSKEEYRGHLITFFAVNAGLFVLNMMTSPGFPWFLFVFGGWGIGIISHWGNKYTAQRNYSELLDITDIDKDDLKTLIKNQKKRTSFYLHIISNCSVAAYLLLINIITSTAFMWALIPIAGMFIGVASHWGQYSKKDYKYGSIRVNNKSEQAEVLKREIIKIINEIRVKFKTFASDLLPKIDSYVNTVNLLTEKAKDLDKILRESNIEEIEKEINEFLIKKENASSEMLIHEYEKHIEDSHSHISTIKNLKEQKELLELKITNSLNNLKQLKLELIGMKSDTTFEDKSVLDDFEKKSAELSLYYKDLLESYDELYK